jgi:hypothetical protein
MEVYDLTSMYDKFVHADMKQKLREMTTLVFEYMRGIEIFTELNEFTDRRNFKRASGQQFKTIEIIYEPSDSKGIIAIASANWSEHDSGYPIKDGVRLDADTLCEMVDYLIDNSYVAHAGIVYKQVIGMAMVRTVMAYGSSLISEVCIIDFHIAAIGVDFVCTCEATALQTVRCSSQLILRV